MYITPLPPLNKKPEPECAICFDEEGSYRCIRWHLGPTAPSHDCYNAQFKQQTLDYLDQALTDAQDLLARFVSIQAAVRKLLS
jgi:hypothetical protein